MEAIIHSGGHRCDFGIRINYQVWTYNWSKRPMLFPCMEGLSENYSFGVEPNWTFTNDDKNF